MIPRPIARRAFLAGAGVSLVAGRAWAQQGQTPRLVVANASPSLAEMMLAEA